MAASSSVSTPPLIFENFSGQAPARKETKLEVTFNRFDSTRWVKLTDPPLCSSEPVKAYSISFKCQRLVNDIDGRFYDIYERILNRQAHKDFVRPDDPNGVCLHNHIETAFIKCGNKRKPQRFPLALKQLDC